MREDSLIFYEQNMDSLKVLQEALWADLLRHLQEAGLEVNAVLARVKTVQSLRGKLQRPDRIYANIEQIHDLIGLRVVTYFEDGVLDVAGLIEKTYAVDWTHSVDKGKLLNPTQFGYRSLHYVCAVPEHLENLTGALRGLKFEIQIRSILQHAWAQMEHDLGYKSKESIPLAFQRRFSRLAGLLEIVDEEFVALRGSIHDYSRDMQAKLEQVPIDSISLKKFVRTPPVMYTDDGVAAYLQVPLKESVFYPEYLARMLIFIGLRTIGDLEESLAKFGPDIESSLQPYFRFAYEMWNLSEKVIRSVERGYCLLFLAHVVVLRETRLEIERMEQLTSFYSVLDYPDDPALAQKAAKTFLLAFKDWV